MAVDRDGEGKFFLGLTDVCDNGDGDFTFG